MFVKVESVGDVRVVKLDATVLDVTNAERVASSLLESVAPTDRVVVDLSNVTFVDSSGLGKIVAFARTVSESGGRLAVCNASASVSVLFQMVKLHQIVTIKSSRDEAIAAIAD